MNYYAVRVRLNDNGGERTFYGYSPDDATAREHYGRSFAGRGEVLSVKRAAPPAPPSVPGTPRPLGTESFDVPVGYAADTT